MLFGITGTSAIMQQNDDFKVNLNVRQNIGQNFAPTCVDAARESLFRQRFRVHFEFSSVQNLRRTESKLPCYNGRKGDGIKQAGSE
jgi:hypothetical protein